MAETYFVTGALGCIGAWVVKTLVERGDSAFVFDLGGDTSRLKDLIDEEALDTVRFVKGDITDDEAVRKGLESSGAAKIVHLAGLQVPFCRADPAKGARVNVLGTLHMFEAAASLGIDRLVYASSAAVYGPPAPGDAPPDESSPTEPATHYGAYKRANEGNARVYHLDRGISSIGLRPLTVYGVGRDQGMTSDPTRALKAAVVRQPFAIRFGGATDFNYAADAAEAFLAAADSDLEGAHVFNLPGDSLPVEEFVRIAEGVLPEEHRGFISVDGPALPLPAELDGSSFQKAFPDFSRTSVEDGIARTVDGFIKLQQGGKLRTHDLED